MAFTLTLQKSRVPLARSRIIGEVWGVKSEVPPRRDALPLKAGRVNNTVILKVLLEYTNGDVL